MKGSISQRKVDANRRNAQKSTGPRTSAGKVRARLNAVTHGILAKEAVVMKGDGAEEASEFAELVESLHAHLQPQDAVERLLIDRVAACYWRLRRAQRFEVGAVREGLDDCKTQPEGPGPYMKKYDASVRKLQLMHDIERHRRQKPAKGRQDPGGRSIRESPSTATDGLDHQAGNGSDLAVKETAATEAEDRTAKMEEAIREDKDLIERAEKQDALVDSRRPFLAALPADEPLNRLIRYETMLDRQLHRALSELRRHRAWNKSELLGEPGGQKLAVTLADVKPGRN